MIRKPYLRWLRYLLRSRGYVPAPETAHVLPVVKEIADEAKRTGEKRVILISFSGHGLLDLGNYADVLGFEKA